MKSKLLTQSAIGFFALAVIVSSAYFVWGQPSPVNDEVVNAQKSNQEAQAAYYRKQLEDKTFWQKVQDNPAAVGAVVAALVALLSFLFNYLATLRNQTDTQFYEAMKRFGDKDSPTLRSSAAGLLCQMGQARKLTFRFRPPFFWRYPYFRTAFDQLITGSLVENERIALEATQSALRELVSARPRLAHDKLLTVNYSLQRDLSRWLANFFISRGSTKVLTGTNAVWKIEEIDPKLWTQAAFITNYRESILKSLASRFPEQFSDFLNAELLSSQMMNEKQKKKRSIAVFRSLQRIAESLKKNASLLGSSFKRKILMVSMVSLFPPMRHMTFERWFNNNRYILGKKHYSAFLVGSHLSFTDLKGIWVHDACLDESVLACARLLDVNLTGLPVASPKGVCLEEGVSLAGANLGGARLFNVDLSHANLINGELRSAKLYSVNFWDAELQGADFTWASLREVKMGTRCEGAKFYQAQLHKVGFQETNLREADFQFAKLSRVDFRRANVSDARFYGASVSRGTNFADVDWWKGDFSRSGSVDESLLQALYSRYGEAIPDDLDIDADAHPSVQDFLKAALQSDRRAGSA